MTRAEALIIARHIAAGACAMRGCSPAYCTMMQDGRIDDATEVQAALAALTISDAHKSARLDEIREQSAKVVEIAA